MIVQNKKSGKSFPMTDDQWEAATKSGLSNKFKVLQESDELPTIPAEVAVADYKSIIKSAKEAEEDGRLDRAVELFEQAYEIKATTALEKRIQELKNKLG